MVWLSPSSALQRALMPKPTIRARVETLTVLSVTGQR
jgi:hypothetical protein